MAYQFFATWIIVCLSLVIVFMVIFQSLVMVGFAPDSYFLVSLFRDEVKEVVVICPLVQQKVHIIVFALACIISRFLLVSMF